MMLSQSKNVEALQTQWGENAKNHLTVVSLVADICVDLRTLNLFAESDRLRDFLAKRMNTQLSFGKNDFVQINRSLGKTTGPMPLLELFALILNCVPSRESIAIPKLNLFLRNIDAKLNEVDKEPNK